MTTTRFQTVTMNPGEQFKKSIHKPNTNIAPLFSGHAFSRPTHQLQDSFCLSNPIKFSSSTTTPSFLATQPFQLTFQATQSGFQRPSNPTAGSCNGAEYTQHVVSSGPSKMTFIRFKEPNADAVGAKAAELLQTNISAYLDEHPTGKPVIITPTGNTPKPFYEALRTNNTIPWGSLRLGHLDEYIQKPDLQLPEEETYRHYMNHHLWSDRNLQETEKWAVADQAEFHSANTPEKYQKAIQAYESKIKEHGDPLTVVLGIGSNGHIAFIEPLGKDASDKRDEAQRVENWLTENKPAHWTKLKESTIKANFDDQQLANDAYTDEAVTLGLDTILSAQHIILLATGNNKKDVIQEAFKNINEKPTPYIPASYLKKHPDVTVITNF